MPMAKLRRWGKRLVMILIVVGIPALMVAPFVLRLYTALRYDSHIYEVADAPSKPVAVIFGAQVRGDRLSTMLADRVRTGADLYHAGKVQVLLMSGDNQSLHYNEPDAMRDYAIGLGVPAEAIKLDRGGIRTYDTCYRAREIFGYEDVILVTQDFHLDRALLTCQGLGMEAVGVAADYHRPNGYSSRAMGWSRYREIAATTVALIDLLRGAVPTHGNSLALPLED
jgi:SanA protein